MQIRLEVAHSKANIKRVLIQDDAILGRSKECNLRIASSQVSRKHCLIRVTDDAVYLKDLGSSNGTFLDGKRIRPEEDIRVHPDAELTVGPAKFIFRFEDPSASEPDTTADTAAAVGGAAADALPIPADQADTGELPNVSEDIPEPEEEPAFTMELSDPESDAVQFEDDIPDFAGLGDEDDAPTEPVAVESPAESEDEFPSLADDDDEPSFPALDEPADVHEEDATVMMEPEADEPIVPEEVVVPEAVDDVPVLEEAADEPEPVPEPDPTADQDEDDAFSFLNESESDEDDGDNDLDDFLKGLE